MNPETSLVWHPLKDGLTDLRKRCLAQGLTPPHWDRVENIAGPGTPDLSIAWRTVFLDGHIELKYREMVPVRDKTPVVISTVSPEQRLWWRQRAAAGGNVKVLLRLGIEWGLFAGGEAARGLGQWNLEEMKENALWWSPTVRFDPVNLLICAASLERM